jgi:methyltransferase
VSLPTITLLVILVVMLAETLLSARNERALRSRGAIEPDGDVYRTMRWAYPLCFVAMAIEGAVRAPAARDTMTAGLVVFAFAKALKAWAIAALGRRWTFRVLVVPDAALVASGPYAVMRHPNYLAVLGELAGMALIVWAPVTGMGSLVAFGALMLRRIGIEDRALGRK